MALHEAGEGVGVGVGANLGGGEESGQAQGVAEIDPCYKLAWCLDACLRNNDLPQRQIREIRAYFDTIHPGNAALGYFFLFFLLFFFFLSKRRRKRKI